MWRHSVVRLIPRMRAERPRLRTTPSTRLDRAMDAKL